MTLSICMIARNESANLPRSLESVRGVADQLVVVDTGSTDKSRDIARSFGAEVTVFPWCDDFSAARNAALERATGQWILWLDADEALMDSSLAELRTAMRRPEALGYLVLRRDLIDEAEPERFTQMWQLRLFRNRADLRFRGRCHPDFHPSLFERAAAMRKQVLRSSITLEHWGYTAAKRPAKLQRALRLLELELRDRPGQLYYLIELFRTQKELGETEGAMVTLTVCLHQCTPHLREKRPPAPSVALLLETAMQLPEQSLPEHWSPSVATKLAERWFPDAPPLIWLAAQQDCRLERFAAAESKLRRLIRMGKTRRYDLNCSFDPRILHEDAMLNLGFCLVRQAKLPEAEAVLQNLVDHPTKGEQAKANLRVVRELREQFGR